MRSFTLIIASSSAILLSTSVFAVEFKHREPFVAVHNCTCRFQGVDVPVGEQRCILTPQGPRTSECVLEQNVTSWRPGHEECPQAALFTPRG